MNILVTGGAGYIGSHTLIELYKAGHTAVVVDNLSNSSPVALQRVAEIIGCEKIPFYKVDIRDREGLEKVFAEHHLDACIHFAGLKAVGESVEKPWEYYENNISGTLVLVDVMRRHQIRVRRRLACDAGDPCPAFVVAKLYREAVGRPAVGADVGIRLHGHGEVVLLRYFNPVGAHASGRIGESPNGIPNNLMPYITQVAVGKRKELGVFGNDYPTPDGTGVRDYIHVVDLANGHVCALKAIERKCGLGIYNLGTGHGYSVLDMVKAFEKENGVPVPYSVKPRRAGDIATCYSNPAKAEKELGWKAQYGINEMVRDSWNWQRQNPDGYPEE